MVSAASIQGTFDHNATVEVLPGPHAGPAADPRGHIGYDDPENIGTADELYAQVMAHEGHVHPLIAVRFIENLHRGGFTHLKDPQAQEMAARGFAALDTEVMLNLYRSIAVLNTDSVPADIRAGAVRYMSALNEGLNLTQGFYMQNAVNTAAFFAPDNAAELEARWQEQGFGREFGCSLAEAMRESHFDLETNPRSQLLGQFLLSNFADQSGLGDVRLEYFSRAPQRDEAGKVVSESRGLQISDKNGVSYIGINTQATGFKGEDGIHGFIETLFHELRHAQAARLVERLERGEIAKGDPEYIVARIMQTNMNNNGYIPPELDYAAYRRQVCEVDAVNAGLVAVHVARGTYLDTDQTYGPAPRNLRFAPAAAHDAPAMAFAA